MLQLQISFGYIWILSDRPQPTSLSLSGIMNRNMKIVTDVFFILKFYVFFVTLFCAPFLSFNAIKVVMFQLNL